jgi:hypothetical protein
LHPENSAHLFVLLRLLVQLEVASDVLFLRQQILVDALFAENVALVAAQRRVSALRGECVAASTQNAPRGVRTSSSAQ